MNRDFRREAALLHVAGHRTRPAVLDALRKGPKCVSGVRELMDIPRPNLSQHPALLGREGIVDFYEDGKLRCCYLTRPSMVEALSRFLPAEYPAETPGHAKACRATKSGSAK